jgi:vacuolar-type H+-ATPase subunit I/STV1
MRSQEGSITSKRIKEMCETVDFHKQSVNHFHSNLHSNLSSLQQKINDLQTKLKTVEDRLPIQNVEEASPSP